MTLEDFFTLTEMKDGLTVPARVMELVNAMQKEKDCIVKNVGDATRQWSTVASTIAATEDKDCLDLFIQLDGLWFIDRWLKDAQKFGNDTSDSFVEESITALLRALEKLHIDYEKSMSYGIWLTVENLLGHSSAMVQDRARALFGSWKQGSDSETVPQDDEKIGASCTDESKGSADLAREGGRIECSGGGIARSEEIVNEEKHVEPVRDEMMPSICSDVFHQQKVDDVQNQTPEKETNLDHEVTRPVKENLFTKEESVVCQSEGAASIDNCTSVVPKQGPEGKSNVSELNEYTDKAKQVQVTTGPPNKLGAMEIPSVSSLVEPRSILGDTAAANAQESVTEPDLPNDTDTNEKNPLKDSPSGDEADMSEGKSGMDDDGSPHYSRSMAVSVFPNQGHDCDANVSVESSGNKGKLQELEDSDTSLSSEDSGAIDRFKGHATDESEDLANNSHFLKKAMNTKASDVVDKSSNLDLDYMVDPLEVALQVAIEVERQVVDCGEPSCSSSEKMSEGGIRQPGSPESIYGKEIQPIEATSKKLPSGPNLSTEALPKEEELLSCTKTLDAEAENRIKGTESSKVTEAAQEPDVNTEKGLGDFDLNQEVCSEDMDRTVNPHSTTPISVVSASRAAAAPGLPVAPLQFEGAHGWKGSAATSAFRPASPRRILESEKILTIGGSHNSSKKRQDRLDFDLNVAVEHSVEASPRRSERLNLDLNRISDEGDAPSDWKVEGRLFHPGNGHCSSSPSSSSSSMQPSLRNFDLNNQPSFYNDSSDLLPIFGKPTLQNLNARGGFKVDDSAISIMGTRVEVNRKDFVPQTLSLPNGRILEPTLDVNLASGGVLGMGSSLPYPHPPVFGYNGFTTGSAVPFSPAMYGPAGPIPYMVDSKGAPVVPQILGSASASPAAYSQPSFVMNMLGTHPGLNGAGNSQFNFDLNSGLMIEGGNRESGGLRQFLNPAHSRSADEHLWANSQPSSSSGGSGKRKEPDGGWEPYPFNYKHHQPPWK